jgi:hypothetical protein
MVQFCPKCGTKAPDDESVFCNKCGTRLPPVIPEIKELICPKCGSKAPDEHSVFCNKCGSPLHTIPPVQVQPIGIQPAAARPVMKKEGCPSCGAPLVDDISDYCNVCGANIHGPVPLTPVRETPPPSTERTGPGTAVADIPDDGKDVPVQEKPRRPLLKWGLIAIVIIIFLVAITSFIPGMTSGTNQSSNTTPAPALQTQNSATALPTQRITQTPAPVVTPTPAKVPATAIPTTVATTNVSAKITTNVSTTVKPTPSVTISSLPYAIGQGATDGKTKVTVNSITFKDKLSDPLPSYAVGKKYLIIEITYENLQNVTVNANLNSMVVTDGGGFTFEQASDSVLENVFNGNMIQPQEKRNGNILFLVPPEATFLKLQYDFGNQNIAKFQLT